MTNPHEQMVGTMVPPKILSPNGSQKKPFGVVPLLIIGFAIALFVLSAINIASAFSSNLQNTPKLAAPGTIGVHLASGGYSLYENVEDASFPLEPASVTVIGPGGHIPASAATSDFSGTLSPLAKTVYRSVVGFTARTNGAYTITVTSGDSTLLVGKSFSAVVDDVAGWIAAAIAAILTVIGGVIFVILRRRRMKRSRAQGPGPVAQPRIAGIDAISSPTTPVPLKK